MSGGSRLVRAVLAATVITVSIACSESSRLNLRCMAGDIDRCLLLGDMYAAGSRVPRNLTRAAELYEKVCAAGVPEVCNTLGEMYEQQVVPNAVSVARIEELFTSACLGNSTMGCVNLGLLLATQERFEDAAHYYERACSAGLPDGCHFLAEASLHGEGLQADVSRALELYDEACEADYVDSCLAVAALFTEGTVIEANPSRANEFYGKALRVYTESCEAGNDRDCTERNRLRTRLALLAGSAARQP